MAAVALIRWDAPGPYEVAFSTRAGGVSEGPFASLSLSGKWDDDEHVAENRRRLCAEVGTEPDALAVNSQRHTTLVHEARRGARGEVGDGLVTGEPGLPVLALAADCLPIAVVRANGGTPRLAVLHAGRRGLLDGAAAETVRAVGAGPFAAVIGPSIGPCCYEVGEEVAAPYRARFGSDVVRGRNLDLWTAGERALRDAGVAAVERVDLCTACNPDLFFSYRRDGRPHGAHGVIGLIA